MSNNCVVDILTHFYRDYSLNESSNSNWKQYMIRIDVSGNVLVSENSLNSSSKHSNDVPYEFTKILEINDNIPIPSYLIPVIKHMFPCCSIVSHNGDCSYHPTKKYTNLYNNHWEIMIGLLKKIKQEIKKTHENSNKKLDVNHEVETYITKFISSQEDKNLELEKKIADINIEISKLLNDNKNLKHNNKLLEDKISKLENDG